MTERDAVDREIAGRLDSTAIHPGGDDLRRLTEATSRGRRIRRRRRRLAGTAVAFALVAVPAAIVVTVRTVDDGRPATVKPADPTRLLGTFTTRVPATATTDPSVVG